jgi:hypothetical protein
MPITSTENTVGQYILYHHDHTRSSLYRDLLIRIDGSDQLQDQFPVTSPDEDSVILEVHNWMD